MIPLDQILQGDVRELLPTIPSESVDCCITSPPYWALRDYGVEGQLGLEPTWRDHINAMRPIFKEVHRILKPSGNLFVNYGDTVATGAGGSKNPGSRPDPKKGEGAWQPANAPNRLASTDPKKHKLGLHYRLRFMLNDDLGFISRADIVWHKPNQMPLSVKDRVTPKYEMLFHLVKQPHYWFNLDPIRTPFAESTVERLTQTNIFTQPGGPKDYAANGMGETGSALRAKRNLAKRFNLRVRDVKDGVAEGKWGNLGVRGPDAEVEAYEEEIVDSMGANPGDVWTIPAEPEDFALCKACGAWYGDGGEIRKVCSECNTQVRKKACCEKAAILRQCKCGRTDAWVSHFAMFPSELVRRLLLSGCPAKVCATCGVPWSSTSMRGPPNPGRPQAARAMELAEAGGLTKEHLDAIRASGPSDCESYQETQNGAGKNSAEVQRLAGEAKAVLGSYFREFCYGSTIPGVAAAVCSCKASFVPGIVLDPFMGSGTTALVAKRHGRNFIGTELNAAYIEIAKRRISPAMNQLLDVGA